MAESCPTTLGRPEGYLPGQASKTTMLSLDHHPQTGLRRSYPFHSFQVPLQQTVQREGDYVVHVLNLKDKKKQQKNILIPFPF